MNNSAELFIKELRLRSSLEMSKVTESDFDHCYLMQSIFLHDVNEAELYNIEISLSRLEGEFSSASNIIKNLNEKKFLDMSQGITLAVAGALAADKELLIKAILGAIFFVQTYKKLSTIHLSRDHVLMLLGVHFADGPVSISNPEEFLLRINSVAEQYGNSGDKFDIDKCNRVYRDLYNLGIIEVMDNQLVILKNIQIEPYT